MRTRSTDTDEMSGHDPTTLKGAQAAREELRARCLSLVRRWHPLAQSGWDHSAARNLGEEVEQIAETSERLNLDHVNLSALELAAYLCSFVDDHLVPTPRNLVKLADMVNRLGAVLTDLSATATAEVHTLPTRSPPSYRRFRKTPLTSADTTRDGDVMAPTHATAASLETSEAFDSFFEENSDIVLESAPVRRSADRERRNRINVRVATLPIKRRCQRTHPTWRRARTRRTTNRCEWSRPFRNRKLSNRR